MTALVLILSLICLAKTAKL